MGDFLTLQQAAERLGVHYMTAYRYVRLGQLPAHKKGAVWQVSPADLSTFQHRKGSDSSPLMSRRTADWAHRLESRLVDGDEAGAWRVVEGALAGGAEPIEAYTKLLVPALRSVGARWQRGELTVADEHVASAVAGRIIGRLGPRFARRGRRRGSVVVAAPSGDRHGLGLAMSADALRSDGYAVVELGADTPADAFERTLRRSDRLRGVCVGVCNPSAREAAAEMVAVARSVVTPEVPIVVGGAAIGGDDDAHALGADRSATVGTIAGAVAAGRRVTNPLLAADQ